MNTPTPHDEILADQSLAPLKRNHACRQCKKRKTKCDGAHPVCSPCLRSHAHAARSANRNGTSVPVLVCTWADGEGGENGSPPIQEPIQRLSRPGSASGVKRPAVSQGSRPTRDEENEILRQRIADLEAKLVDLSSATRQLESEPTVSGLSIPETHLPPQRSDNIVDNWITEVGHIIRYDLNRFGTFGNKETPSSKSPQPSDPSPNASSRSNGGGIGTTQSWESSGSGARINIDTIPKDGFSSSFGLDDLFVIPANWPRGLPSPFLLEHLVETFFNHVPQTPRMLHRPTLLARIKLPPTSDNFPFPGLLHAICATASSHTAWVNNLSPHQIEAAVQKHVITGMDLTSIEDFGLAQAEMANRSVDLVASACVMGGGDLIFQVTQTCVLLSDIYFCKGFPLKGWLLGGQPARLINTLQLSDRNPRKSYKEPLLSRPRSSREREERLATLWMAFINDSGFACNSTWVPSMSIADIKCSLPTTAQEWSKLDDMLDNPQNPESEDLFTSHPMADSFVLVIKSTILLSEVAQWLRNWSQRTAVPGDELAGPETESFKTVVRHIEDFISTTPSALKNVFKLMDSANSGGFNVNLLALHIFPNIALALMFEPFIEWKPSDQCLKVTQQAYEAILGVLHLIPSNLDVTMIFTPLIACSLYTVGRIVADYVKYAMKSQQYSLAARYRADLSTIQNLLERYGQRHSLGSAMSHFLENYVRYLGNEFMDPTAMCSKFERQLAYPSNHGTYVMGTASDPYAHFNNPESSCSGPNDPASTKSYSDSWSASGPSPSVSTPARSKTNEPSPAQVYPTAEGESQDPVLNWDWGREAIKVMGVDASRSVSGLATLDGMPMYMGERSSLNMDGRLSVESLPDVSEIGGFEGLHWKMGKNQTI
ncbi:hypothetical protein C343_06299 [Cryptococcus neoformans C23]|uniref:Zn(2)-C6 fungal-type domain-containing protein n=2 Tax=Cryptococcus neoformans TaxID=5207 RepID=A0A854Q550_CRYNE|nr:hypothetical protein CNAG_06097 [Cryptococcus neoformans var. grubii H99]AUB28448.1 hypothetical protein CKF44_06097 [Cryptococcus neoformans var. grubii]OWZ27129.1 hypothetical protein C347_06299 [Cryptococcus neoformans var. grubii AD2-60a]OWZ29027.1 hypothetical protein C353_06322 [Cryptococcus neoformans var. grubii AD1-83a]OWZ39091.1 hypothetical protein C343_06299 [Cryptococcus neoformans var. grubii C23]OWZ50422.1 hypothetical protein C368_06565 [Cryptococcus neoformans var. grubii 1|eukprot:XP_012053127.1 hypothetical protein CNAG_06097 [Cryptococcus neoformans var. grubii H99]